MSGQWQPATFEVAMYDGLRAWTESVLGETRGAFGINVEDDGLRPPAWFVTHLPTGRKLVETDSRAVARRFCAEIEPLADWGAIYAGRELAPGLRAAVLEAYHRARGAVFVPIGGCDA